MGVLKNPLFEVKDESGSAFGGAQRWFPSKRLQGYGCGVIACANILTQAKSPDRAEEPLDREDYLKTAKKLAGLYLPVIPGFGLNGIVMSMGFNLYNLFHGLHFISFWGFSRRKMSARIEKMLAANIPVCLAVGPNFPNIWGKHCVNFYRKEGSEYIPDTKINAHYVSVTGMDEEWYEISTWGRRMYLNRGEFDVYAKKRSGFILSNILYVKKLR